MKHHHRIGIVLISTGIALTIASIGPIGNDAIVISEVVAMLTLGVIAAYNLIQMFFDPQ